jgi:beta-lactam-binding protein with PASTA domain
MELVNESPRVLGNRYEIGDLLGRGGMAEVHLGRDTRLGRTVAIKLLRTDLARDPTFQARFRREAQSAAALNHPAIVAVYDTGEETVTDLNGSVMPLPYIVMEHVEGRTLRDVLAEGRPLDVDLALEVSTGVLTALEYSHRIGIVHRDIKPANVMLTPNGDVKVMDFGIARAIADASSTMTQTQAVIGTAQYLSPEQARGEQVDTRSDLYSTGALLFELLTGRPPFVADSPVAVAYQHVREEPPVPSDLMPSIPESVDRIVLHALAKDREARYQTAAEFRADVEAARGGRQVAAPVPVATGVSDTATQFLGAANGGTRAMPPVATGMYGAQSAPPTSPPYADQYTGYGPGPGDKQSKRTPLIIGVVVLAVLALVGYMVYQTVQNPDQPTTVAVPEVVGLQQAAAEAALQSRGLRSEIVTEEATKSEDVGNVLKQSPGQGENVEKNSVVRLTVGAEPGTVAVPDVTGDSQDDARTDIEEAGLKVGDVQQESTSDPDIEPGEVIRTDPEAGTKVKRDSEVALFIASNTVEVPEVIGLPRDQARDQLIKAGFDVLEESEINSDADPGVVIDQAPRGGTAKRGSKVKIIIAQEPEETGEPEPTDEPTDEPTETASPTPTETDTILPTGG